MPRRARIDAAGALHHIICRGIERRKIFLTHSDRDDFLVRLGTVLAETGTPCYAWALMGNHFHLLLRSGNAPVAKVMSRLLTGYAGSFNRRHRRSGHLFQNRYKSVLCEEDAYFLELVRYIHLNPLRAEAVAALDELDRYPFCGHGVVMGNHEKAWQDADSVLRMFGRGLSQARSAYREFVAEGIPLGRRPELTGGGLVRSAGGWQAVKALRRSRLHVLGDERILGSGDFVESVLSEQAERLHRRYEIEARGYDFAWLSGRVGEVFAIDPKELLSAGRQPRRVAARGLLCYWAVRELRMTTAEVARRIGITQSAVSRAVVRGERLAKENRFEMIPSNEEG